MNHAGLEAPPDQRDCTNLDSIVKKVKDFVDEYFPGMVEASGPALVEKCMYTVSRNINKVACVLNTQNVSLGDP